MVGSIALFPVFGPAFVFFVDCLVDFFLLEGFSIITTSSESSPLVLAEAPLLARVVVLLLAAVAADNQFPVVAFFVVVLFVQSVFEVVGCDSHCDTATDILVFSRFSLLFEGIISTMSSSSLSID